MFLGAAAARITAELKAGRFKSPEADAELRIRLNEMRLECNQIENEVAGIMDAEAMLKRKGLKK